MQVSTQPLRVRIADLLATGFYSGHAPTAPGTFGTLAAALLYVTLDWLLGGFNRPLFALAVTAVGVYAADIVWKAGLYTGGRKEEDPQQIVVDEFAGYAVSIIGVNLTPASVVLTFLLFRLFDITKPPPASTAERLPGGWGIVIDDVFAGFYALLTYHLIVRFGPSSLTSFLTGA